MTKLKHHLANWFDKERVYDLKATFWSTCLVAVILNPFDCPKSHTPSPSWSTNLNRLQSIDCAIRVWSARVRSIDFKHGRIKKQNKNEMQNRRIIELLRLCSLPILRGLSKMAVRFGRFKFEQSICLPHFRLICVPCHFAYQGTSFVT